MINKMNYNIPLGGTSLFRLGNPKTTKKVGGVS